MHREGGTLGQHAGYSILLRPGEENNTLVRGDLLYLININLPNKKCIHIRK